MNDGRRLRRQDHQAVVDGFGEGAVSGDGEAGDFAEGEEVKVRSGSLETKSGAGTVIA